MSSKKRMKREIAKTLKQNKWAEELRVSPTTKKGYIGHDRIETPLEHKIQPMRAIQAKQRNTKRNKSS